MAVRFMGAGELGELEPMFKAREVCGLMETAQYFSVQMVLPELFKLWGQCSELPQWESFEFSPDVGSWSGPQASVARGLWVDGVAVVVSGRADGCGSPTVHSGKPGKGKFAVGKRVDEEAIDKAIAHLKVLALTARDAAVLDKAVGPGAAPLPSIRM